jgi:hypothetical protein
MPTGHHLGPTTQSSVSWRRDSLRLLLQAEDGLEPVGILLMSDHSGLDYCCLFRLAPSAFCSSAWMQRPRPEQKAAE